MKMAVFEVPVIHVYSVFQRHSSLKVNRHITRCLFKNQQRLLKLTFSLLQERQTHVVPQSTSVLLGRKS